jgi:hypothetical protein
MGMINGKLNIKKYYFTSFMFILHTSKKVLNKILKCIFFSTKLFLHISRKSQNQQNKTTKKINQLNIATWKKNNIKFIKK